MKTRLKITSVLICFFQCVAMFQAALYADAQQRVDASPAYVGGASGIIPSMQKNHWSISFDDVTIKSVSSNLITVCNSLGARLQSVKGQVFDIGKSSGNCIAQILDKPNASSDPALCISVPDGQWIQNVLNQSVAKNFAYFEMDILAENFNAKLDIFNPLVKDENGNSVTLPIFAITTNGNFRAGVTELDVRYNLNEWLNVKACIGIDNPSVAYYIDDVQVYYEKLDFDISEFEKMRTSICTGRASRLWIDNIKSGEAVLDTALTPKIYINNSEVDYVKAGNVSIECTLGYPGYDVQCIFAMYNDNKLTDICVRDCDFNGENKLTIDKTYLGNAVEGSIIKMFCVSKDNICPASKPIVVDRYGASHKSLDVNDSSLFSDDKDLVDFMKDKFSLHLKSSVLYKNGERIQLASDVRSVLCADPYQHYIYYVPSEFFEVALGLETKLTQNLIQVGEIEFKVNERKAVAGDREYALDAPAYIENSVAYIPFVNVMEDILGYNVNITNDGSCQGAAIISNQIFQLPDDDSTLGNMLFYENPDANKILNDYRNSQLCAVHPRVLADKSEFDRIRHSDDEKLNHYKQEVVTKSNILLSVPVLKYELRDGVRLWYVSMDFMERVFTLAMAYQLTQNSQYAERCLEEMKAAANFPDWHSEHGIDVGGMAVGYAIGYDWIYDYLNPEQRAELSRGYYNKCLNEYVNGYNGYSIFMKNEFLLKNNHNPLVNSGIIMSALAFMDEYPKESAYCISEAIKSSQRALEKFFPDGSDYEGIGYGLMTMEYLTLEFSVLTNVFGTVYSLDKAANLVDACDYYIYLQSPTGAFAYGDGAHSYVQWKSGLLWMAQHYGKNDIFTYWYKNLSDVAFTGKDLVTAILFYNPETEQLPYSYDTDKLYTQNSVVVMRDSWDNEQPTFFAAKGASEIGNDHLDNGTFLFISNGTQWVSDLGSEDYNLDGYWEKENKSSKRWRYFRNRAEAHNCLIINPDIDGEYIPNAKAEFIKTQFGKTDSLAVLDMSDALSHKAQSAKRGYFLTDNKKSLVVRDEIRLGSVSDIYWFLQTKQEVRVSGKEIIFIDKDNSSKKLSVEIVANVPFEISTDIPKPLPTSPSPSGLASNDGYTRLAIKLNGRGNINITAKLTPFGVNGRSIDDYNINIDDWTIKGGN